MGQLVLVADDEAELRQLLELNLAFEGFDVITASDGAETLEILEQRLPDIILLDIMMPRLDGLKVIKEVRANERTAAIPVIMISARALTASEVLSAGADDYVIKPFNPIELVARLRNVIVRGAKLRDQNPLTGLPGNAAILRELRRRIDRDEFFSLMHIDIDNFKAFNDKYGFMRGDRAITTVASVLREVTYRTADSFLGHIGGDDFVIICPENDEASLVYEVFRRFDQEIRELYDASDRVVGFITVPDRQGVQRRFPLMTLSVGVVSNRRRKLSGPAEASHVAAEMKAVAKRRPGNSYSSDRRVG